MKRISRTSLRGFDYEDDIERIMRLMRERGWELSPLEVHSLWTSIADDYAMSWMVPGPSDTAIKDIVERRLAEFDSEDVPE